MRPRLKPHRTEPRYNLIHMRRVTRLQHKLDLGTLHRQIGEGALMMNFFNVGIGIGDDGGDFGERAGEIAQLDFYSCQTA